MPNQSPTPFCHIVIPAPDLEKASSFYEQVFGWRVQRNVPGARYWFFESGNVGGAFSASKRPTADSTVLILEVDDMEAAVARVVANGGEVTQAPGVIGEGSPGRDAYFTDSCGNGMGLYSER